MIARSPNTGRKLRGKLSKEGLDRLSPVTLRPVGQYWWSARYTDHEIEMVWVLRDEGFSVRAISERLDMPRSTVADVVSGRWRRFPGSAKRGREDGEG